MPPSETSVLTDFPSLARRRISVAEYHRMGEAGILGERERIELIDGELIAMAPIGSGHSGTVNTLTRALVLGVGERGVVAVQNPVILDDYTEPEPDFSVLKPRPDNYFGAHPTPADVLLIIEVAQSSIGYDRAVKSRIYARSAIPEFWIVDLMVGTVEVRRDPSGEAYGSVEVMRSGVLEPSLLPGLRIALDTLLAGPFPAPRRRV